MGFQDRTGSVFAAAITVVAFGGAFLPALHPLFDIGEGGSAPEDGSVASGRFFGETLTDMTLRNCEVHDGRLVRVQVYNCLIVNTQVVDSQVSGGTLRGGSATLTAIKNARIEGGRLDNVTVNNTVVDGSEVTGLIMQGGTLKDATVSGGSVTNTAVTGGSLKWVTLRSTLAEAAAIAAGASIRESQVENYTLEGGSVAASTLVNTKREGTDVQDCAIQEADLVPRSVGRSGRNFVVTVANSGDAGAYYYEVVFRVDGREAGKLLVKATVPGQSTSVAVPMPDWAGAGALEVTVDAADRIPERNEGNNLLAA